MKFLKQSTAYTFRAGKFVDSTDGATAETALTIAQADVQISKAGGAFASKNDATAGAHDTDAFYSIPLNATDTNTLGTFDYQIDVAGALNVKGSFMVMPAAAYDAMFGTELFQSNVDEIKASASAAENLQESCDVMLQGTVTTGATTASIPTSLTFAATDLVAGRTLYLLDGTTRYEGSDITACTTAGVITVNPLTNAPADGVKFEIV